MSRKSAADLAGWLGVPPEQEPTVPEPPPEEEPTVSEPTPRPTPLTRTVALPSFPIDALPRWLAEQVAAVAMFTQTPPALAGWAGLGVLSACAGGGAVVEVRGGWREPLNLFLVAVSAPGTRKSQTTAAMTGPLLDVEQDLVEHARAGITEADTQRRIAERAAEGAKAAAGRAEGEQRAKLTAEAISAALAAEAITVPTLPRVFADNATPEATASLLAEQGGRLAILSAEGGIFDVIAGRYSGGIPDLDVYLKGHAGDALRVDRKGRPPEYVRRPALTVSLAVQPAVLHTIGRNPAFAGRGLLARFLYALPANNVGRRRVGTAPVPAAVADRYAERVTTLASTLAGWSDPAVLTLDPAAADALLHYEEEVEPRLAPEGDLGGIAEWGSKLVGATVRIAGLLHLAADPDLGWKTSITAADVAAAIRVADFATAHALAAFDQMGADASLDDARAVLDHLRRHQVEKFTVRSLFSNLPRTRFPRVGDLHDALDVLEAHGWVTPQPAPPKSGPGRPPSPAYTVHPAALSAQSAQTPSPTGSADSADYAATTGGPS